jgi:hypothetical protein
MMGELPLHLNDTNQPGWLLCVLRLPSKPAYLRVKAWRRLQEIGAVVLKNAVYVLPATERSTSDFRALLSEMKAAGGDGVVCEARVLDGLSDKEIRKLFNDSRNADYEKIAATLRGLKAGQRCKGSRDGELKLKIAKARKQFSGACQIDFFEASGQATVEALLARLEHSFIEKTGPSPDTKSRVMPSDLAGKIWVTRQGIHADRIACSWLIKRFIDPGAKLKFVPEKRYLPRKEELRFDMAGAEFTHEGDKCSFEVILDAIENADPALVAIGEIVHNLDLQDGKFDRPEANGIGHVIEGICLTQTSDHERLVRGRILLDDTYERFKRASSGRRN